MNSLEPPVPTPGTNHSFASHPSESWIIRVCAVPLFWPRQASFVLLCSFCSMECQVENENKEEDLEGGRVEAERSKLFVLLDLRSSGQGLTKEANRRIASAPPPKLAGQA